MAAGLGLAFLIEGRMATEWLYWRSSYAELDATVAEGMAMRVALLVGCGLLAVSFFALVPRAGTWFSHRGSATLVVYPFDGFAVLAVEYAGFPAWASAHPLVALEVATPAAAVLALLLAWPPVARRLDIAVDPVGALRRRR